MIKKLLNYQATDVAHMLLTGLILVAVGLAWFSERSVSGNLQGSSKLLLGLKLVLFVRQEYEDITGLLVVVR